MRAIVSAFAILSLSALAAPASADPYRWCADYGNAGNQGTNCYFRTIDQCRAAISGNGGYCRPNPFFSGDRREPRTDGRRGRERFDR